MRIRIQSDGTAAGTKIVTDTGELITGCTGITWHVTVSPGIARATLEFEAVEVDCIATTDEVKT